MHRCLCVISDDLDHDTSFVNKLQELVCDYIKSEMPEVTSIEYWSDGCAGQYKCFKNMMNLCLHKEDFGLGATWYFFATLLANLLVMALVGQVSGKLGGQVYRDQFQIRY